MPLQLFLNDLSIPQEAVPHAKAINSLKSLVSTIKNLKQLDSRLVLNSYISLKDLQIGTDWNIAALRNNGECVEENQFLKNLNNTAPFKASLANIEGPDGSTVDYQLTEEAPVQSGTSAEALGLAHFLDGLGVSFSLHPYWDHSSIPLDRLELSHDGTSHSRRVIARNVSNVDGVPGHRDWILKLDDLALVDGRKVDNGRELWKFRSELFPNLVFIPRTQGQMEGIVKGDPLFKELQKKLKGIDQAIAHWQMNFVSYPTFPFHVTPESATRENLTRFKDEQGEYRVFSDHARITPGGNRIHFIIETNPKKHALIGHIGRKLGIG